MSFTPGVKRREGENEILYLRVQDDTLYLGAGMSRLTLAALLFAQRQS